MNATLRTITPAIARLENYTEITTPINPRTEAEIFRNLERQLAGVDGVWIQHPNGTVSAARRKRDLLPLETLLPEHARRDADPILDSPPAMSSMDDSDRLLAILDELEKEDAQ